MDKKDLTQDKNFHFFPWECITIFLENREIDLVIRNEEHMKMFIRFLVYNLRSVDGNTGSAEGIYKALLKQNRIKGQNEEELLEKIRHQVMLKTSLKYTISKVRQKISFSAFRK
jgi:hypothetical protein